MSRCPSSTEIEDSTKTTVNNETDGSNKSGREPSVAISKSRSLWFLGLYMLFVMLFIAFFFIMAFKYPLKPELYLTRLYIPAFDKSAPDSPADKNSSHVWFKFVNRNKMISATYDMFSVTIQYYVPNSNTSRYVGNLTTPADVYQDKGKPVMVDLWTPIPGISSLRQHMNEELPEIPFLVYLDFKMRFHCKEVGNNKHRFLMSTIVWVSLEYGCTPDKPVQMFEGFGGEIWKA
ncbi:uncharacterized protein [Rutidosis leptorrhynchoides]|uniref:uncharacterized protein n=1 Tax=Rutidosis leptorrhynchoides TaxID=125765 RepID=UPI003A98E867